jgi:iron complex outermembrane recepter protein
VRTSLPGGARLELAAYVTGVSNELIPFEDPAQPGRVFYRNAGSSLYRGTELVLATRRDAPVRGQLTWSWVDAQFRDYVVGANDYSDNKVPGQSPHRLEGIVLGRAGGWSAEVRGEWVDAIPVNDANSAESPSYTVVDLRFGSSPRVRGGWRFTPTAGITNLLDESYVASVAVNAFGGRFYEPGPGRSFHLGVTVGFERR